jgi:hypothetical protein
MAHHVGASSFSILEERITTIYYDVSGRQEPCQTRKSRVHCRTGCHHKEDSTGPVELANEFLQRIFRQKLGVLPNEFACLVSGSIIDDNRVPVILEISG